MGGLKRQLEELAEQLESQERRRREVPAAPAAGSGFIGWQQMADSLEMESELRQRETRLVRRLGQVSQLLTDRNRRCRGLETQVVENLKSWLKERGS